MCVTFVFSALLEYALVNYALRADRYRSPHLRSRRSVSKGHEAQSFHRLFNIVTVVMAMTTTIATATKRTTTATRMTTTKRDSRMRRPTTSSPVTLLPWNNGVAREEEEEEEEEWASSAHCVAAAAVATQRVEPHLRALLVTMNPLAERGGGGCYQGESNGHQICYW